MKFKLLCTADIASCPSLFAPVLDICEIDKQPRNYDIIAEIIHKYDIYFASLDVKFDRDMLKRAQKLKILATPSTGTDHIDMKVAVEQGIEIVSLKNDTAFLDKITSTAELAWAILLAVVRKIIPAAEAAKNGVWGRDIFRGHQLSGKTLGILGYGRLGRILAEYGKAFRMKVLVYDTCKLEPAEGVEFVEFEQLLKTVDVLSIHIHLNEENRHLIGYDEFNLMKNNAIVVNTSRGAIIDETALLEALKKNQIAGAAIDVIDGEWCSNLSEHPLIKYSQTHNNLLITPHIGGVSYEAQSMTFEYTVEKIKHLLWTKYHE